MLLYVCYSSALNFVCLCVCACVRACKHVCPFFLSYSLVQAILVPFHNSGLILYWFSQISFHKILYGTTRENVISLSSLQMSWITKRNASLENCKSRILNKCIDLCMPHICVMLHFQYALGLLDLTLIDFDVTDILLFIYCLHLRSMFSKILQTIYVISISFHLLH